MPSLLRTYNDPFNEGPELLGNLETVPTVLFNRTYSINSSPMKTPATAKIKAKTIVIAVTTPL